MKDQLAFKVKHCLNVIEETKTNERTLYSEKDLGATSNTTHRRLDEQHKLNDNELRKL